MSAPELSVSRRLIAKKWTFRIQVFLLIFVGVLGILISLGDLFLPDWQAILTSHDDALYVILLIVSMLSFATGLERQTFFAEMESSLDRTNDQVHVLTDAVEDVGRLAVKIDADFRDLEQRYPKINAFFRAAQDTSEFYSLAIKYGLRRFTTSVDEKTIRVQSINETLELWRECILEADSWTASSYASNVWGMGNSFGDQISNAFQKLSISLKRKIERIFVVDNESELEALESVMRQQAEFGVTVKWIEKAVVIAECGTIAGLGGVNGTWDFALAGGNWVFCFELDERRQIVGSSMTIDSKLVEQAKSALEKMSYLATPYQP